MRAMAATAQSKSTFSISRYLASCIREVEQGTTAVPGHPVVGVHFKTFQLDLNAARPDSISFVRWIFRTLPRGTSLSYAAVRSAVGDGELALKVMALGEGLAIWRVHTPVEDGLHGAAADRAAVEGALRFDPPVAREAPEIATPSAAPTLVRAIEFG
jgi:hypothetical protein